MVFNTFIWGLYRDSDEGRATIEKDVSDFLDLSEISGDEPFTARCDYFEIADDEIVQGGEHGVEVIDLRTSIREHASNYRISSIEDAENFFTETADQGLSFLFENAGKEYESVLFGGGVNHASYYGKIYSCITGLTAGLYDAHPEFFVPYLFSSRFDQLEKICHSFDITISEVPGKLKKRERALYYLSINRAFYEFRKRHELSPKELTAFLYHFAPKSVLYQPEAEKELPPASRVWFVIGGVGGNGDFEYLDAANQNSFSHWQGSLETRRGDIILMWCASPRSYLHSVWRALDEGFNDPFFYYYSLIRIGKPVKITPIPFAELSKHPLLGSKPVVRGRLQGASGTPFSVEDYKAICELLQNKGFDISVLPAPPATSDLADVTIQNERDVEVQLLEPLLLRLGFKENDWIRQFPLRMGRGERNYPDYVLGGNPTPGEESAFALIECKCDIESKKDMKEAFVQAKSYALRLQASVLVLAARRGLWVFQQREDGFSIDHYLFRTWRELSHPDVLHQVSLIIGNRKVNSSIHQKKRNRKHGF